ncbi:MAG: FlgD immunoglobulin-like domain containing protein [candidate division WOR-3 bacterium]|nr:FlgD immunoglobulin-like domain containing protein [candidate division WOR-3 bacterium]
MLGALTLAVIVGLGLAGKAEAAVTLEAIPVDSVVGATGNVTFVFTNDADTDSIHADSVWVSILHTGGVEYDAHWGAFDTASTDTVGTVAYKANGAAWATATVTGITIDADGDSLCIKFSTITDLFKAVNDSLKFTLSNVKNDSLSGSPGETFHGSVDGTANGGVQRTASDGVEITPAAATKLVWTTQPASSQQAGVTIDTGRVTVQDQYGNTVSTSTAPVNVKAYRVDNDLLSSGFWSDGTLSNTVGVTETAVSGVATFGGIVGFDFSKVGTYYFKATSTGLTPGNSDNVTITYNTTVPDMKVTLTTPATMEVNTTEEISGLVKDKYGNIVTGGVNVNFYRFAGSSTWGPDSVAASATGYAATDYTSGTSVLIGDSVEAYTTGGVPDTNYIALTPGALAAIGATPPDYGITNAAERVVCDSLSGPFDVELQDVWGNHIDAEDVAGKQITVGTVHGPLHGSVVSAPVLYGDAGAIVWRFNYTGGDSVVAAGTDTIPISATGVSTIEVYARIIGGPVHTFTMDVNKDSVTVCGDSTNTITCEVIDAKDKYGNLTEGREITFAIAGDGAIGAAGDACTTDAGGKVTDHVAYKAGSKAQLITLTATATDGGVTADTTIYLIAEKGAANIDAIEITGDNAIFAGQTKTLTFTYFDEFGNVMNIADAAPGDTSFDNITAVGALGAATPDTVNTDTLMEWVYGVVFTKPYEGEPTLTEAAQDTIVATANAGAVVDTFLMSVLPVGEASYFTVVPGVDTLTVNNAVTLTITAYDADSNRIYTYGRDTIPTAINLSHSGTADTSMWSGTGVTDNGDGTGVVYDTIFTNGLATVNLTNRTAETLTASVAEAGKLAAGESSDITWIADSLDHFGIVAQTEPIYTGIPFTFTVTPYDVFGNVTSLGLPVWIEFGTNEVGVSLPAGPLQFTGTTDYPATASNASTSMILTVGTTDGLIHGISAPITVIGLYTLSGTVGLSDNPSDLSGSVVMVTGGFSDTTDVLGHYEIPELLKGTYNIIVSHEGYQRQFVTGVDISANTVRNFMLEFITGIEEIPAVSFLSQNKPNPFAGGTTVEYGITKAGNVEIVVYNAVGQKVRTLVNSEKKAGYHKVNWDGTNDSGAKVGGGIYFYKITAGEFTSLKKLILLR